MQGAEHRIKAGHPGAGLARAGAGIKTRVLSKLAERMGGANVHWSLPAGVSMRRRQAPRALARICELEEDQVETDASLESLKAELDRRGKARRPPSADPVFTEGLRRFAPGPRWQGAMKTPFHVDGQCMFIAVNTVSGCTHISEQRNHFCFLILAPSVLPGLMAGASAYEHQCPPVNLY